MVMRCREPAKWSILRPFQPPADSHPITLGNQILQCVVKIRESGADSGDCGREPRRATLSIWRLEVWCNQIGQTLDSRLIEATLKQCRDALLVMRRINGRISGRI